MKAVQNGAPSAIFRMRGGKREGRELSLGYVQPALEGGPGGLEPSQGGRGSSPPTPSPSTRWANPRLSSLLVSLPPTLHSEDSTGAGMGEVCRGGGG